MRKVELDSFDGKILKRLRCRNALDTVSHGGKGTCKIR
jgi:hypothetical protein